MVGVIVLVAMKLGDKNRLDELTDKQRKVVELAAANPNMSASKIDDKVGSNQYAYAIINKYQHLIDELRDADSVADLEANCESPGQEKTANGEVKTEWSNGSFEGSPIDATMQYFSERDASVDVEDATTDTITVSFELNRENVEEVLINSDAPKSVRELVAGELLNTVFDE